MSEMEMTLAHIMQLQDHLDLVQKKILIKLMQVIYGIKNLRMGAKMMDIFYAMICIILQNMKMNIYQEKQVQEKLPKLQLLHAQNH